MSVYVYMYSLKVATEILRGNGRPRHKLNYFIERLLRNLNPLNGFAENAD